MVDKGNLQNIKEIITPKLSFPRRLQRAVINWYDYSEDMRKCRQNMLNLYQNAWFQGGGKNRTPLVANLLDEAISIIAPCLINQNPRVNITPRRGTNAPNVKVFALILELALTHLFDEINLAQVLRQAVVDSLFSIGIVKTGTDVAWKVAIGEEEELAGQPYSGTIDFDDYIGDVTARHRAEMKIEGHKYRLPLNFVVDSGLYKHYDRLQPGLQVYGTEQTSPEKLAKNDKEKGALRELWPTVELFDIFLPDENIIVTIPPEGQGSKIMRTVECDGPQGGPFDALSYKTFPGSCIPIPPVYIWLELNKVVNTILNKMREQCEREKTIGVYPLGADEDARVIQDAKHGQLVGISGGEVQEVTFGGWHEQSFPFVQFLLSRFNKSGPNLGVVGGKGVFGKTLGQEQMLQANAMRELDDMVNQVYTFTKSIIKKLAWNLWSDPFITLPLIKRIAGKDIQLHYSEAVREGDFFDYTFEIEPYSLSRMNPEIRYQRLLQLVSQIVLPLTPLAAQQGSQLVPDELIKECAKYLHINNIEDWWKSASSLSINMNPYQPLQATPTTASASKGPGVSSGKSEASDLANLSQQQSRATGELQI